MLDLRGPSQPGRGLQLHPVTNGPLGWQWTLLAIAALTAGGWLVTECVASWRRRRSSRQPPRAGDPGGGRSGRVATTAIAAVGALAVLVTVAVIRTMPGLVDVGFLGWMAFTPPARLAFHLPLAVTFLATCLTALLMAGALRQWWARWVRPRDAALAVAMTPSRPSRLLAPGRVGF